MLSSPRPLATAAPSQFSVAAQPSNRTGATDWKKWKSGHQRQVMTLHMNARKLEPVLPPPVVGGADAGELDELVNEVGLVEIPAFYREPRPIDLRCAPRRCDRVLEPLYTPEEFRCNANLGRKRVAEAPLAQVQRPGDIADPRAAVSAPQYVQSHADSTMVAGRIGKPLEQSLLHEPKPLGRLSQ